MRHVLDDEREAGGQHRSGEGRGQRYVGQRAPRRGYPEPADDAELVAVQELDEDRGYARGLRGQGGQPVRGALGQRAGNDLHRGTHHYRRITANRNR